MPIQPPVDGPPPSPATDPAAAQEAKQPMPVSGLANPIQMQGQGPDLSGVLKMAEAVEQGLLSIMQAVPQIAPDLEQVKAMFMASVGKFVGQAGSSNGSMPGAGVRGQVVTQAGSQFPAAGQGAGRPF